MTVVVSPRAVLRALAACVAALVALSAAGWFCRLVLGTRLFGVARAFDVGYERSVPTWFSIMDLAFAAVLLAAVAAAARRAGERRDLPAWTLLAGGFTLLCMDELLGGHEQVGKVIQARWHPTGYWTFGWVIPALVLVAVLLAVFLPFLRRQPARRRGQFLAAGALFVGGAVGMEMIGGKVAGDPEGALTPAYLLCTHLEELLEMSGVVLFNFALLEHLAGLLGPAGLTLKAASE